MWWSFDVLTAVALGLELLIGVLAGILIERRRHVQ